MKRLLLIVGILGVLLVAGILLFLLTGLGAAIKAAVESVGPEVTRTEVKLASADVSLTSGEGTLKGLLIGNPKGFATPSAIELGEIRVKIDTSTVTSDVIVIKEVVIDGPEVTYEVGSGGSNIGVIQENVNSFTGGDGGGGSKAPGGGRKRGGGGASEEPAAAGSGDAPGTKIIIEDLVIRNGRVSVSATFLGGKKLGASLAEVHLTNLGKDSGGATAGEIAKEILGALTGGVMDAVGTLNLDSLAKGVTDTLGGALGGALDGATDILGGKKKKRDR